MWSRQGVQELSREGTIYRAFGTNEGINFQSNIQFRQWEFLFATAHFVQFYSPCKKRRPKSDKTPVSAVVCSGGIMPSKVSI